MGRTSALQQRGGGGGGGGGGGVGRVQYSKGIVFGLYSLKEIFGSSKAGKSRIGSGIGGGVLSGSM